MSQHGTVREFMCVWFGSQSGGDSSAYVASAVTWPETFETTAEGCHVKWRRLCRFSSCCNYNWLSSGSSNHMTQNLNTAVIWLALLQLFMYVSHLFGGYKTHKFMCAWSDFHTLPHTALCRYQGIRKWCKAWDVRPQRCGVPLKW